jgi:hypothetical protein
MLNYPIELHPQSVDLLAAAHRNRSRTALTTQFEITCSYSSPNGLQRYCERRNFADDAQTCAKQFKRIASCFTDNEPEIKIVQLW